MLIMGDISSGSFITLITEGQVELFAFFHYSTHAEYLHIV